METIKMKVQSTSKWYDTREGVESSLEHLDDFNRLINERREAGYDRNERMNKFFVLDRLFMLDECGNVWKLKSEEVYSMGSDVPTYDLECACGDGWNMSNIADTVVNHSTEVFDLNDFVGKTLAEVKAHYKTLTDAHYGMQSDILIRNDANIDLSPKYANPEHDWQKDVPKNELGWVSEREGITDEYIIQEGDEGFFNMWKYSHKTCNEQQLEDSFKAKFKDVFESAGFEDVELTPIQNRYCPCNHCAPWYQVDTEHGQFTIGWRKRVINIDWTGVDVTDATALFEDEDVTKDANHIHAWSYDSAKDYLGRIQDQF